MARRPARSSSRAKRARHASVGTDGIRSVHRVAPDRWLYKEAPRGSRSEKGYGELRAVRVPPRVISTLKEWGTSQEQLRPLARLIRDMLFAYAYYHAQQTQPRWAAGTAREPHYKQIPENPGALGPLRKRLDEVIANLETLRDWQFRPPIELEELDAKLKPTGRIVKLSRLDENLRRTFERARQALLGTQRELHDATRRPRGRKAGLVKPFGVAPFSLARGLPTPARRRELVRMLRDEIFALHPDRKTRRREAKAQAGRLAHLIIGSLPLLAD